MEENYYELPSGKIKLLLENSLSETLTNLIILLGSKLILTRDWLCLVRKDSISRRKIDVELVSKYMNFILSLEEDFITLYINKKDYESIPCNNKQDTSSYKSEYFYVWQESILDIDNPKIKRKYLLKLIEIALLQVKMYDLLGKK